MLKGFSQRKLAIEADISKSYLSNIETGAQDNVGLDVIEKIAGALGFPINIFMAKVLDVSQLGDKIPIIGFTNGRSKMNAIEIGTDGLPSEPVIGELDCVSPIQDKKSYAVIVKDNSMAPLSSDWICIVSPALEITPGDLVNICVDNIMHLRILNKANRQSKEFITTHPEREPEIIFNDDLQFIHHVWGFRSPVSY